MNYEEELNHLISITCKAARVQSLLNNIIKELDDNSLEDFKEIKEQLKKNLVEQLGVYRIKLCMH